MCLYYYISLLLIIITCYFSWAAPMPGPGSAPCAGAPGRPSDGPGGTSAEGPSERAQHIGWGRARARPMNNGKKYEEVINIFAYIYVYKCDSKVYMYISQW